MGATPVKVNPLADFLNRIIAMLITGVAAPVIINFGYAQLPWLKFPIVKQIFEGLINRYAGKFSVRVQGGVTEIVIDAQTGAELSATVSSLAEYQAAKDSGDAARIEKARQNSIDRWGDLIHWDGIAEPHES